MNVEIFREGVSARGYGFIVWDESGVVESVQVHPIHHKSRHVNQFSAVASSQMETWAQLRIDGLAMVFACGFRMQLGVVRILMIGIEVEGWGGGQEVRLAPES